MAGRALLHVSGEFLLRSGNSVLTAPNPGLDSSQHLRVKLAGCGRRSPDGSLERAKLLRDGGPQLVEDGADLFFDNVPLEVQLGSQLPDDLGVPVGGGSLSGAVGAVIAAPRVVCLPVPLCNYQCRSCEQRVASFHTVPHSCASVYAAVSHSGCPLSCWRLASDEYSGCSP